VTVTVIIPTYRRSRYLDYSLASFTHQRDSDFEIVVVNDGGDEDARHTVEKYRSDLHVTYLWQEHDGRSAARNRGLAAAGGELLVFCDDCMIADPELIRRHASVVRETENIASVGWKRRALTCWTRGRLQMIESDFLALLARDPALAARLPHEDFALLEPEQLAAGDRKSLPSIDLGDDVTNYADIVEEFSPTLDNFRFPWMFAITGNLCVRRQQVLDNGGFSEDYRGWGMEDTDLGYRLHRDGVRFAVNQEARTYHQIHPVGQDAAAKDLRLRRIELARNFRTFYEKYGQDRAVRMFWCAFREQIDLLAANQVILDIEAGRRRDLPEEYKPREPVRWSGAAGAAPKP